METESADLIWPRDLQVPSLENLDHSRIPNMLLNAIYRGRGPREPVAWGLTLNYLRTVDHAIAEYELMRRSLYEAVGERTFGPLFGGIAHLETCLTCCHRAIRFADKVKRTAGAPRLRRHLEIFSAPAARGIIKRFRDQIEHWYEELPKEGLSNLRPAILRLGDTSVVFAGQELRYGDIARWLTQLAGVADEWADFDPGPVFRNPPPSQSNN